MTKKEKKKKGTTEKKDENHPGPHRDTFSSSKSGSLGRDSDDGASRGRNDENNKGSYDLVVVPL